MRRLFFLLACAWFAVLAAVAPAAAAGTLIADLSQQEIKITTGFAGTELLLYGVTDSAGGVIVTISGPEASVVVRKKTRVSGIWINTDSVEFEAVPGYYYVAATEGLSDTELADVLQENGVGFRYLNLKTATSTDPARAAVFREALLRRKEARQLYSAATGRIDVLGGLLFRTRVRFPANVPTGVYQVNVYHVEDGWVTSTTAIPLSISKGGLEESVFRFAQHQPALYGVFAIVVAAVAGYGAGMVFGRR